MSCMTFLNLMYYCRNAFSQGLLETDFYPDGKDRARISGTSMDCKEFPLEYLTEFVKSSLLRKDCAS